MNSLPQKYLDSGEIRFSGDSGYHCNICDVPLEAQPLQHLNGIQHKNKAFFTALQYPTEYSMLNEELPEIVREAVNDNIIEVHDLQIECHSCRVSLSGRKPLTDHLISNAHRKKTDMKKLSRDMKNLTTETAEEGASKNPMQNVKKQKKPTVSNRCDDGLGNIHSKSKMENAIKTGISSSIPAVKYDIAQRKEDSEARDHTAGKPTDVKAFKNSQGPLNIPGTMQDDSVEEKAIQSEVEKGYIEDLDGVYKCRVCHMPLTGREPLLQHINGKKHRSKTQAAVPKTKPQVGSQQLQTNEEVQDDFFGSSNHRSKRTVRNMEANNQGQDRTQIAEAFSHSRQPPLYSLPPTQLSLFPGLSMFETQTQYHTNPPSLMHEVTPRFATLPTSAVSYSEPIPGFNTMEFPHRRNLAGYSPLDMELTENQPIFTVRKTGASWPRPPSTYKLLTRPRGYVIVFNNHFDDHPDWKRDGSKIDDENLKSVFEQMEYKVGLYPNTTRVKLFKILEAILTKIIGVDSLILFFLSHGKDERHFYSADKQLVDVRDIWIKLTDQNCPALKDKPKILFMNYCRGETKQANSFFDNISEREEDAPKDVALVHASLPGFKAQRLPTEGTVFIHSLCQVLCESVCEKDIHDIINETTRLMRQRGGTTPSIEFIEFNKFYFL